MYKHLFKAMVNALSINLIYLGNSLIALILIPYLAFTLGIESFGNLAFLQAVESILVLIATFSFPIKGVQLIAEKIKSSKERNEIVFSIWLIQFVISLLLIVLLLIYLLVFYDVFYTSIFLTLILSLVAQLVSPLWLYHGFQFFKQHALLVLASRMLALLGVFIFVKAPGDQYLVILLNASSAILLGIIMGIYLFRDFFTGFLKVRLKAKILKQIFLSSLNLFYSRILITGYTTFIPIIIKFFMGDVALGIFAASQKLVAIISHGLQAFSQATFPMLSEYLASKKQEVTSLVNANIVLQSFIGALVFFVLFFFAEEIIFLIYNEEFYSSIIILKILSILPLLTSLSQAFSYLKIFPMGEDAYYFKVVLIGAILSLILVFYSTQFAGIEEISMSIVLVETIIFLLMLIKFKSLNINHD